MTTTLNLTTIVGAFRDFLFNENLTWQRFAKVDLLDAEPGIELDPAVHTNFPLLLLQPGSVTVEATSTNGEAAVTFDLSVAIIDREFTRKSGELFSRLNESAQVVRDTLLIASIPALQAWSCSWSWQRTEPAQLLQSYGKWSVATEVLTFRVTARVSV